MLFKLILNKDKMVDNVNFLISIHRLNLDLKRQLPLKISIPENQRLTILYTSVVRQEKCRILKYSGVIYKNARLNALEKNGANRLTCATKE